MWTPPHPYVSNRLSIITCKGLYLAIWVFCLVLLQSTLGIQAQPPTPIGGFPQANDIIRSFSQDATYMYIAGDFTAVGTPTNPLLYTNLAKCTITNSLPDPNVSAPQGVVEVIVPDGVGGFFVGGQFNSVIPGPARNRIFHLLANGTVDPGWNAGAIGSDVFALAYDGTNLYVGGSFTTIGGQVRNRIARLSGLTGAVDLTWDANLTTSTRVMAIVVNGGNVYFGGQFTAVNGQTRNNIAKVDATTGALDMAWNPDANNTVETLALDGGFLYLGGAFGNVSATPRASIARVNAVTGTLDAMWNPGADAPVYAITPDASGIYIGGNFGIAGLQLRKRIARLSASGVGNADSWDPGLDPVNNLITRIYEIRVVGGSVFVGGNFDRIGGQPVKNAAKLDIATGNADITWQPNRTSQVQAIGIDGAGNMLLGGGSETNSVGGYYCNGVARIIKATKALDISWRPFLSGTTPPTIRSVLVNGADVFVGGFFNRANNMLINNLVKFNAATAAVDAAWNPLGANSDIFCMATDGTNLFLGGGFFNIGGVAKGRLAKLTLANPGTVDAMWNPNASNTVHTMQYDGAGNLYVGGDFTFAIGGQSRNRIAKLSTSGAGAADPLWDPNASSTVYSLALSGTDVFVGGNFTSIGGQSRSRIAKLSTTGVGAADPTWIVNAGGLVFALFQNGADLYVGGNFSVFASQPRNRLAKISAVTGVLDMTWNPGANNNVNDFAYDAANQYLYCGGVFTMLNGGAVANRCLTVLPITAAPSFTYYYESGDPNLPISWGTQVGPGLGTAAVNFNNTGDLFVVENGIVTAPATGSIPLGIGVTMQINGTLKMGAFALTGGGNFQLNSSSILSTGRADGINGISPLTGTVQLSGTITYNPAAGYEFDASAGNILTNVAASGVKPAITVMNNLTTLGTNITTLDAGVTVQGVLSINSGIFSTGAQTLTLGASATASVMNTARLRIASGGSLLNTNSLAGSFTVHGGGILEINGNGAVQPASASAVTYIPGSTLEYSGSAAKITNDKEIGSGGVQQLFITNTSGVRLGAGTSVNVHQGLNVVNACVLQLDNIGNPSLSVNGTLNLNLSGAFSSQNGANSGSLSIGGAGNILLRMAAGNETLLNFTLNRTGIHTLLTDLNVLGIMNLQNGAIVPTTRIFSGDPLGSAPGIVASGGSGYVQGKLQRRLAGGIASNGTNYFFPIGTVSGSRVLTLNDALTGASPVIEAQVFDAGATTTDMTTLTRLFSPRNWYLQAISGVFNGSSLALTETGLTGASLIGRAVNQSGTYSSVGGNSISTSILSNPASVPAAVNHYFSIGVIAPSITSITPLTIAAGDTIVITGANLSGVSAVGVGGFPVSSFTIQSPTRIRAIVGQGGTGVVTLVSEVGVAISPQILTFVNNPIIETFSPSLGTTGSTVTIRGARFLNAQRVSFGGIPAQRFIVLDANTIEAVVDNGQTGVIAVQTPNGSALSTGVFTFYRTPSITRFTPVWAKIGDTVQIYGINFQTASKVRFGNVEGTSFRIVTSGQLSVQIPPGAVTSKISIENIVGADTSQNLFTVVSIPRIFTVTPSIVGIGMPLVIEGDEFHPIPTLRIGTATASTVRWEGLSRITVRFSTTASGALTLIASGGTVSLANPFSVVAEPRIFGITPITPSPGDIVIVTGANFVTGATTVRIGNTFVPVTVQSSGQITFIVPSALNGNLTIATPGGTLTNPVAAFNIVPAPRITALSVTIASVGQSIEVNGVGFLNMSAIRIAGSTTAYSPLDLIGERLRIVIPNVVGLDVSSATIISSQATIFIQTRSGVATIPILLTNRTISTTTTVSATTNTHQEQGTMKLTGISPLVIVEGNDIRLEGENIPTTATVLMNGIMLRTFQVESSRAIVCRVPIGTVPVNVQEITVRFGVSTSTAFVEAPASVRVESANNPQLFGFYPPRGNIQTVLSIIGQNLSSAQTSTNQELQRGLVRNVSIGGIPVLAWKVISPTLIVVTVGTVQSGVVRVETASGVLESQAHFILDTMQQSASEDNLGGVVLKDSLALNRFFAGTEGSRWTTSTNWTNNAPIALRFGVRVQNQRVVELRLPQNNVIGLLPPDVLRDLDALRIVDLSGNMLNGALPREIAAVSSLEVLRLGKNFLKSSSGTMTSTATLRLLCGLQRLRELDLSENQFSDSISVFECIPPQLTALKVQGNQLVGRLSGRLVAALANIVELNIARNRLEGELPDNVGQMIQLQRLSLRGNRFSGRFPYSLGKTSLIAQTQSKQYSTLNAASNLEVLDLGENMFSGNIGEELGNLSSLKELHIDRNSFSGTLPISITQLTKLKVFDCSYNMLSGSPPLSTLRFLDSLAVNNNYFSFSVLERFTVANAGPKVFIHAEQRLSPPILQSTDAVLDAPFELNATLAGQNNRYTWRKDDRIIRLAVTEATLSFPAFMYADTGRYSCEITNLYLPELILTTATVRIGAVLPRSVPSSVRILTPTANEVDVLPTPLFSWSGVEGAARYRVQVSLRADFTSLRADTSIVQTSSILALKRAVLETIAQQQGTSGFPLPNDALIYWRVRAENILGNGEWVVSTFTTLPQGASLAVQTLDCGRIPRNDSIDVQFVVRNIGTSPVHIVSASSSHSAFRIFDATQTIPENSVGRLTVRFLPNSVGRFVSNLTLTFRVGMSQIIQTQTLRERLIGQGGSLKFIAPNFGTVLTGKTRIASAMLINVSDKAVSLEKTLLRQNSATFSMKTSPIGITLQPLDTISIAVSCRSDSAVAVLLDTLLSIARPLDAIQITRDQIDTAQTVLRASVRNQDPNDVVARIGIRALQNNVPPGTVVNMEVYLMNEEPSKVFNAALPTVRGILRFNENVLVLDRSETAVRRMATANRTADGLQGFIIPQTSWIGRSRALMTIRCIAVAGAIDRTPLSLEDVQWGEGSVIIDSLVGDSLTVLTSRAGGKRLIVPASDKIKIVSLSPNPTKDMLEMAYILPESGFIEIALLNVKGEVVQVLAQEVQSAGNHTLQSRVDRLPSGGYTIQVRMNGQAESRQVQIVK